jgi:hypothetical protein
LEAAVGLFRWPRGLIITDGILKFNGSNISLPYKVYYTPSPTIITNVIVGFPAAPTLSPTFQPSKAPSKEPSLAPTYEPSLEPSTSPTNAPSFSPSHFPTLEPTNIPTNAPTNLQVSASSEEEAFVIYWLKIGGAIAGGITTLCLVVCCAVKPIREIVQGSCKSLWNKTTSCMSKPNQHEMPDLESEGSVEISRSSYSQSSEASISGSSVIHSDIRNGGWIEENMDYLPRGSITVKSDLDVEGSVSDWGHAIAILARPNTSQVQVELTPHFSQAHAHTHPHAHPTIIELAGGEAAVPYVE